MLHSTGKLIQDPFQGPRAGTHESPDCQAPVLPYSSISFIYFFKAEREHEQGRGAERERERERKNPKQAPSQDARLDPTTLGPRPEPKSSQMLNQLSTQAPPLKHILMPSSLGGHEGPLRSYLLLSLALLCFVFLFRSWAFSVHGP